MALAPKEAVGLLQHDASRCLTPMVLCTAAEGLCCVVLCCAVVSCVELVLAVLSTAESSLAVPTSYHSLPTWLILPLSLEMPFTRTKCSF